MPKVIDYKVLKTKIIKNAYHVFLNQGFAKTSMSDISKACDMKRTALYHYYENKESIFNDTVIKVIDILEKDLIHLLENDLMSSIEKIRYINLKWEEEFGLKNLAIFLLEVHLKLLRDESEFFINLNKRIIDVNKNVVSVFLNRLEEKYLNNSIHSEPIIRLLKNISSFIVNNQALALE